MTPCTGQLGFPPCSNCARLRPEAIMRPIAKLATCAMYEPSKRSRMVRDSLGRPSPKAARPRKPKTIRYAGAPA